MWCWFYHPHFLPPSYNRWILALARMDPGLLSLLRLVRTGEYAYGQKPSAKVAAISAGIAARMGKEPRLVNPAGIRRLDCSFVHGKHCPGSCEVSVAKRWALGFADALKIYLPVSSDCGTQKCV